MGRDMERMKREGTERESKLRHEVDELNRTVAAQKGEIEGLKKKLKETEQTAQNEQSARIYYEIYMYGKPQASLTPAGGAVGALGSGAATTAAGGFAGQAGVAVGAQGTAPYVQQQHQPDQHHPSDHHPHQQPHDPHAPPGGGHGNQVQMPPQGAHPGQGFNNQGYGQPPQQPGSQQVAAQYGASGGTGSAAPRPNGFPGGAGNAGGPGVGPLATTNWGAGGGLSARGPQDSFDQSNSTSNNSAGFASVPAYGSQANTQSLTPYQGQQQYNQGFGTWQGHTGPQPLFTGNTPPHKRGPDDAHGGVNKRGRR